MYRKLLFIIMCVFLTIGNTYAEEVTFSVEVHGVVVNGGTIYVLIYSNNNSFKSNQPDYTFSGNSTNNVIRLNLQIPEGEYVMQAYQDVNNNGRLDFGLFNIPREPVGMTNFNGRGIPGNFDRHKVIITNGTSIIVPIRREER